MALVNYKAKNNASTTMASGISAGAVSMIVATGAGDLFPTTFPFELTLEQFTGSNVTKREIVKCTARTGDTLTIVRSWDYCPASYTALTQTNTAFAFSTGDTVSLRITASMIDDIYAELVQLRTDLLPLAGGALTGPIKQAKGTNVASASTLVLSTATGNEVHVTGTTTITAIDTVQAGAEYTLIFDGILTLTHNATTLFLSKAGANITTAVNDVAKFVSEGSGNWRLISYIKADGTALVSSSPGSATNVAEGLIRISTDAEALTGTLQTVCTNPLQLHAYTNGLAFLPGNGPATAYKTYYTYYVPFITTGAGISGVLWSIVSGALTYQWNYGTFTATASQSMTHAMRNYIPGSSVTPSNSFVVEFACKINSTGTNSINFGIGDGSWVQGAYNQASDDSANFTVDTAGNLYAHTTNGSGGANHTESSAITGVTLTSMNTYRIEYNSGVNVLFYVNGVLKATISTTLPNSGGFSFGCGTNGSTNFVNTMTAPHISILKT